MNLSDIATETNSDFRELVSSAKVLEAHKKLIPQRKLGIFPKRLYNFLKIIL